jgi:hypothetical protein
MSHDGLPVRAGSGAREARADRRASSGRNSTSRHLAIATGVFAIVALLAAACNAASSSSPSGAGASPSSAVAGASVEPSIEVSAAPSAPARLALVFKEANSSKVFGGGVLNQLADGTTAVTLGVVAIGYTDPLPANLEAGACADLAVAAPSGAPAASGSPEASAAASAPAASAAASAPAASPTATPGPVTGPPYKLNDVNGGSSNTIIQAAPADLVATPFAIVLQKSAGDPTVVACADITNSPVLGSSSSAAPAASAPAESLPAESAAPSAS